MDTTETLLANLRKSHIEYGTSVRCPVCHAGAGKWCMKAGTMVYRGPADRVLHPERVALAAAK